MDATAKSQMLIIAPLGIKAIRIREPRGIAVACGKRQCEKYALGNGGARQRNLVERGPLRQELDRWLITQEFLHGGRDQVGAIAQALEERRVPQQREHPVAK